MKRYRPFIVGAVGGVLAAAIVPLTGIIDFASSSGQWAVTELYYRLAVRQSVTLRSSDIVVPDLEDEDAVRRAAGHYELVCATCHGSPAAPPAQIALDLVPPPPVLVEQMRNWRPDARIYFTVMHGIKWSAMPAWPTRLREDEVWDMVAFLKAMPAMDAADYAEAAGLDRTGCAACHGTDGEGTPQAPRLDIQSPQYIAAALEAFRARTRASGTMIAVAATLSDEQIASLATDFGRGVAVSPATGTELGAMIAERGIPERDIAACNSCHNPGADPTIPRLAGQDREYIATQLGLFAHLGVERGGHRVEMMVKAIRALPSAEKEPLSTEEIEALADYYGR